MRLYLLGLLLLAFTTSPTIATFKNVVSRGQITCNADHCNPNWAPFENMQYALRGYSIRKGRLFQSQVNIQNGQSQKNWSR